MEDLPPRKVQVGEQLDTDAVAGDVFLQSLDKDGLVGGVLHDLAVGEEDRLHEVDNAGVGAEEVEATVRIKGGEAFGAGAVVHKVSVDFGVIKHFPGRFEPHEVGVLEEDVVALPDSNPDTDNLEPHDGEEACVAVAVVCVCECEYK